MHAHVSASAAWRTVALLLNGLRRSFRLLARDDHPGVAAQRRFDPIQAFIDRSESRPHFATKAGAHIEELALETFYKPFDLVQGPLYRVEVLRRGPDDLVMVFAIHHAIADGWTLGVFVQDLCAAYVQQRTGGPGELAAVPTSYSAWGAAERTFWQSSELEPRIAFWKSQLAETHRLWSTSERPKTSFVPHRLVTELPAEIATAARKLARLNGATLFSTLLAAFQVALSRWAGEGDIVVGTPVANRTRQDLRETMGYFSGVVPLRGQVERKRDFSEHVRLVHQTTVDAFANAMPFAELVQALGEGPTSTRNPIFQVRFALQNHPVPDVEIRGLSVKLRMRSTGTPRFDLGCEVTEQSDALEIVWLFSESLFSRSEIEDLGRLFRTVLESVCEAPERRTAALTT